LSISLSEVPNGFKTNGEIQWVVFCIAGSEMGVGISHVKEIIRVTEVTTMPKAPKYLEGIINLRSRIIPVLDLKRRFSMPLIDPTSESRILIVEIKDQILGFLVDKVLEVLKVSSAMVSSPKGRILNVSSEFIEEVLTLDHRQILFLNLTKLFVFDEVKSISESR
jgi:purine-binding chemotaxis protein CheW